MIAFLCIQCRTPDQSEAGTFLVLGEKGQPYKTCDLASPVFSDLADLAVWLDAEGWEPLPYEPDWPVGRYQKTAT